MEKIMFRMTDIKDITKRLWNKEITVTLVAN